MECPYCKKLHESGVKEKILKKYPSEVSYVLKHFPLSFHKNAKKEHEAFECVKEL
jgi:protein-disulfide isomerase